MVDHFIAVYICSAYQQDQIRELEPLRSHLRLVTEECDRKIQARWAEEQAQIGALKREKQQLQRDIEAMTEKEKAMQAVVHDILPKWSSNHSLFNHSCNLLGNTTLCFSFPHEFLLLNIVLNIYFISYSKICI